MTVNEMIKSIMLLRRRAPTSGAVLNAEVEFPDGLPLCSVSLVDGKIILSDVAEDNHDR